MESWRRVNLSFTARVSIWYWYCVWTADRVSLRRSTLLPLAPTGVSVGVLSTCTPPSEEAVRSPLSTAWRSELSKSTLMERNPGVSTLEMLSAVTFWRRVTPSRASPSTRLTESDTAKDTGLPPGKRGGAGPSAEVERSVLRRLFG